MKLLTFASAAAVLFAAPSFAQTSTSPPAGPLPESMRIQQQTTQQFDAGHTPATTEAPGGGARSPLESNRLDPAAPSSKRLQIDDGTSAATRTNPDASTLNPGSTYNTIIEGAPSNNGMGSGQSGTAGTATSVSPTTPTAGARAGSSLGSSGVSGGTSGGASSSGGGGSH